MTVGLQAVFNMRAVWVKAWEVLPDMARAMGDRAAATDEQSLHARALATLRDKLWLPDEQRYAFALLEGGKLDRKSTRLNSSHQIISYAVFCLKKKKYIPKRFVWH